MILENKLTITDQVELNRAEEKISKQKAKQLFETGEINRFLAPKLN
jgi:cell filamentation protein